MLKVTLRNDEGNRFICIKMQVKTLQCAVPPTLCIFQQLITYVGMGSFVQLYMKLYVGHGGTAWLPDPHPNYWETGEVWMELTELSELLQHTAQSY